MSINFNSIDRRPLAASALGRGLGMLKTTKTTKTV
jgi:hypothetical protein